MGHGLPRTPSRSGGASAIGPSTAAAACAHSATNSVAVAIRRV